MGDKKTGNVMVNRFVRVFDVGPENLDQVLIFFEEDHHLNKFFTVTMTRVNGKSYATEVAYDNLEDARGFVATFTQEHAEYFYNNTVEFGESPPPFSLEFLLEKDYDGFMDWLEEQDPHNLKMLRNIMGKDERLWAQVEIMDIYSKGAHIKDSI